LKTEFFVKNQKGDDRMAKKKESKIVEDNLIQIVDFLVFTLIRKGCITVEELEEDGLGWLLK
jgi:hypothetical protein